MDKENNQEQEAQKAQKAKEQKFFEELKKMSDAAKQASGGQQTEFFNDDSLGDEDIELGFDTNILDDSADPQESHRLYYTIQGIMISNLPKGAKYAKLRKHVFAEKSLFLNRGKDIDPKTGIRGSDQRMTFIANFLNVAFDTVVNWVKAGADPYELYMAFRKLNEERGYRQDEEAEKDENLSNI